MRALEIVFLCFAGLALLMVLFGLAAMSVYTGIEAYDEIRRRFRGDK